MVIENVLLIAVQTEDMNQERFHYSLNELRALARTVGAEVADVITQNRKKPHQAYYVGEGKLDEIYEQVTKHAIDIVIANQELSGGQLRNLQDTLGVRVIDRSQLILDIFAKRARTKEGKLQVELAQYAYMLPRLHGQGEALSRLGGGIGTRGPGETKLETDRRHIQNRMDDIKKRLKTVANQREQYRGNRRKQQAFQIAIVGYTNAGKSTLFNGLTKSDSLYEDKLFATLDPLTRKVHLPSGLEVIVTDTVGFIQDLPTPLIAAFRSTLEEVNEADLIVHVIDANAPNIEDHQQTVQDLLEELDADKIPLLTLYNKRDLVTEQHFIPEQHPYLLISANDPSDINEVKHKIEAMMKEQWKPYSCFIPEEESYRLRDFQTAALVTEEEYNAIKQGYQLTVYANHQHPIMKLVKEYYERDDRRNS
ncbi:GTP-binding protein protease modulator [Gracilibacillus halophilus YIM-C55.5]|uniref:GTPase HflX n=1 Tax=Gracilibacillus halophilus YIM-C55.5 TaxID=1308866 RepID=N4W8Q6_9BACI|nr:GTPase HflX [Gracilibacillus halophilus]ENH96678.1 GTP-binding protein protease modulator [Gracilibacillus halophilus YIM-C55.5]